MTPAERQRRNEISTSNRRPPIITTSSNRSAASDSSPISSQTSGHPSLYKSLPPTPISESVRSSLVPLVGDISPRSHLADGVNLPPQQAETEYSEKETFTPTSDISEGPRIAARVALPPWRDLSTTPVSPQSLRSSRSSQNFESGRYPTNERPHESQITTRVTPSAQRRGEDGDGNEDYGENENSNWNVLRSPGGSRWPRKADSRW